MLPNIVIGWQIGSRHGWGVHGYHLAKYLLEKKIANPVPLQGCDFIGNEAATLLDLGIVYVNPTEAIKDGATVIACCGNHPAESVTYKSPGPNDCLIVCFEISDFTPADIEMLKRFKKIITLSIWNMDILRSYGVNVIGVGHMGIDPDMFKPTLREYNPKERFTIFSGGKMELRKGQDIVLAAFKEYLKQDPNALLVTAWHNPWPLTAEDLNTSPYNIPLVGNSTNGEYNPTTWAVNYGIPEGNFADPGYVTRAYLAKALKGVQLAVFPNRCEGATNLVAMECIAAGVPVTLSNCPGHDDLKYLVDLTKLMWIDTDTGSFEGKGKQFWREPILQKIVEIFKLTKKYYSHCSKQAYEAAEMIAQCGNWNIQIAKQLALLGLEKPKEVVIPQEEKKEAIDVTYTDTKEPTPPVKPIITNPALKLAAQAINLRDKGFEQAAIVTARKALSQDPKNVQLMHELGNVLLTAQQCGEAKRLLLTSAKAFPEEYLYMVYSNLGLAYHYLGEDITALEYLEKAAPYDLGAAWDMANVLLHSGDWERGWKAYEVRRLRKPNEYSIQTYNAQGEKSTNWDGEVTDKTLLVYVEQGIGDTFQFSRYLLWARQRVGKLIFLVFPELAALFSGYPGVDQLSVHYEGVPLPEADYTIPLGSLPLYHKTIPNTIPADPQWIPAVAERFGREVSAVLGGTTSKKKVGFCWAGTTIHLRDRDRSIKFEQFLPLFALNDIVCYSLQVGPRSKDISELGADNLIADLSPVLTSWIRTAIAISQLDLVITVDTAVCHLAGIMGKPTWLLLPKVSDWRWLAKGRTTGWYPKHRLYRQLNARQWDPVIQTVLSDLSKIT